MQSSKQISGLIAGIGGGLVFFLFYIILAIPLLYSISASLGAFVSLFLITKGKTAKATIQGGGSAYPLADAYEAAKDTANQLNTICKNLPQGAGRNNFLAVAELCEKMAANVQKDPKDSASALRFLNYYGQTTIKIATIYHDLSIQKLNGTSIQQSLQKIEQNSQLLVQAFKTKLVKLQEDNLMELESELRVLNSAIEMEGLGAMIKEEGLDKPSS
jgi:hypothetical protein